jgi:hypothetical protein
VNPYEPLKAPPAPDFPTDARGALDVTHAGIGYRVTASAAQARLAAKIPKCKLDSATAAPVKRMTMRCEYSLTASYTCSTAPG